VDDDDDLPPRAKRTRNETGAGGRLKLPSDMATSAGGGNDVRLSHSLNFIPSHIPYPSFALPATHASRQSCYSFIPQDLTPLSYNSLGIHDTSHSRDATTRHGTPKRTFLRSRAPHLNVTHQQRRGRRRTLLVIRIQQTHTKQPESIAFG